MTNQSDNPIFLETCNFSFNTNEIFKENLKDFSLDATKTQAALIFEKQKRQFQDLLDNETISFVEKEMENVLEFDRFPDLSKGVPFYSDNPITFEEFLASYIKNAVVESISKKISLDITLPTLNNNA